MGSRGFEGFLTSSHLSSNYKSKALADLYGRLSHRLIRANARAILSRSYSHLAQQVDGLCVKNHIVCSCVYM